MLGMLIIFLRLLLSAESITSRFTGELKVLRPENLAVEIYEEGSPFAFLCQVPVLAGTLTLRVGEFDPLVISLPCASPSQCTHNKISNQVSVSVTELPIGTHSVQFFHEVIDQVLQSSQTVLFDIVPARNNLEPVPLQNTLQENSPIRLSYCAAKRIQVESVAIISSLVTVTNGQSIFLLKLASALAKMPIQTKNGSAGTLRVKWIAADSDSPSPQSHHREEIAGLKRSGIEYVKAIMVIDESLYKYAGNSIKAVAQLLTEMPKGRKVPATIQQLIRKMLEPISSAVQGFDVVHFTTRKISRWEDELMLFAIRASGVPVVIAEPGNIELGLIDNPDAFVVPSTFARNHMKHHRPKVPVHVMTPWIDSSKYKHFWPLRAKRYMDRAPSTLNIAYIGRLTAVKSPGIFLRAANILLETWKKVSKGKRADHVPDLMFSFIGEGQLNDRLQAAIKTLDLRKYFKIMKLNHEAIPSYLAQNVDIVVHTTLLNETFCYSNLEAMASEIPVVTFGVGGVQEYLSQSHGNGERGIVVSEPSPEAMAFSILNLISNRKMRREMGVKARKYVTAENSPFQETKVVSAYARTVNSILCNKYLNEHTEIDLNEKRETLVDHGSVCAAGASFKRANGSCKKRYSPKPRFIDLRHWREWHRQERGDSFGDLHALVNPIAFLNHRNESFPEIEKFYEQKLAIPMPHPIRGGKFSPKNWARRGNFYMTAPHKLTHDIEQLEYLIELGRLPEIPFSSLVDKYTQVLAEVRRELADQRVSTEDPNNGIDKGSYLLKLEHHRLLGSSYNTALFSHSSALKSSNTEGFRVISPSLDFAKIEQLYAQRTPSLVIVDNFLTEGALDFLYNHCLESTFWYTIKQGYLGAHHDDGLSHPVLEQLVTELRDKFPNILQDHKLTNLWAYKSSQDHTGVPIHADDASVSFNMWITPDDANFDSETGGLVIYPVTQPNEWSRLDGNKIGRIDEIKQYLQQQKQQNGVTGINIPYKANRVVIFDSRMFHHTGPMNFKKGYKNRRINLTFLFSKG